MKTNFLAAFNFATLITALAYVFFFLIVIFAVLKGFKRGAIKSTVRFACLIVCLIIAGLVSMPIAKLLAGINVSFLGMEYNGKVATTLADVVRGLVDNMAKGTVVEGTALYNLLGELPLFVISLVVFFVLTWLFRLISYIIYLIINRCFIKSSKEARKQKKEYKAQKKAEKKGQKVVNRVEKPKLTLTSRLIGMMVGFIQAIVLAFVIFLPFGSILNIVGDLSQPAKTQTTYSTSGDLIRYYAGDDILMYFDAYNNTFVSKFVAMGGLNLEVFDEITKLNVNDEKIQLREEIYTVAKAYDDVIYSIDLKENEKWKDIDVEKLRGAINNVLDLKLLKIAVPDLVDFALDKVKLDMLPSGDIVMAEVKDFVKENKSKIMETIKTEVNKVIDIGSDVLESGLLDDVVDKQFSADSLLEKLKANDNALINKFVDTLFESDLVKILGTTGINYGGKLISDALSLDPPIKGLESSAFGELEKKGLKDIVFSLLDCYDVFKDVSDIKVENMTDAQVEKIASVLTSLQNNTFKIYNVEGILVERENTSVDKEHLTVINGGPFSNLYVVLVNHFVGEYFNNPNYKGADWHSVLKSIQALTSLQSGETPKLEDVMGVLGLDENLGKAAEGVVDALSKLDKENVTQEDISGALKDLSETLDEIDEETFNNVLDKLEQAAGIEDLQEKVSYETLTKESGVAGTLSSLVTDGITSENVDESLDALANSQYVLEAAVKAGAKVENKTEGLEEKIEGLDVDESVKNNLKSLFNIE